MDSEDSVNWLRRQANRNEFMRNFGTEAEIRERGHHVLVDFVPCSTDTSTAVSKGIEKENGMAEGTIVDARWMRATALRKPGQKFLLLRLTCQLRPNREDVSSANSTGKTTLQGNAWKQRTLAEPVRRHTERRIAPRETQANASVSTAEP